MALDMTTFAAALKQHYKDLTVKNLVYKNNPLFALMPKYEKFGGANMPLPLIYGNPQGRSATFANALAQKTNSQIKAFTLTRVSDYSLANIQNEVLEASQGDADAFMRAATTEIDGAFQSITRSIAQAQYRDGTGVIGNLGSKSYGANVTTIVLSSPEDIVNFEVGQTIVASVAGTIRANPVAIATIDRSAGSFTVPDAGGLLIDAVWQVNDGISVSGDTAMSGGAYTRPKLSGLAAWIPYTAPSSTAFFGVDRTSDVSRLAGQRKDISALPIEEGLIDLAMLIAREGGAPTHDFMNFQNFANLEKALGSKVIYQTQKDPEGIVGFEGIKIHGQKGPITVIADQNCPSDKTYMLQMDTWSLNSLGMAPKLLKSDGMDFLRVSTDDAVEVRVGAYLQMGCVAPGWNGVGKLS
jgi:hypothetical protein